MYVKLSHKDLNLSSFPPSPHKHLYLWSDHYTKGVIITPRVVTETKLLIKLTLCFIYDLFIVNQVATIQQRGRERKKCTLKSERVITNISK